MSLGSIAADTKTNNSIAMLKNPVVIHEPADAEINHPFFKVREFIPALPRGLKGFYCEFNNAFYDDNLFSTNNILLPDSLKKAVNKRKAEFFSGRYCAKKVLEKLGYECCVGIAKDRSPLWPKQRWGSISHSRQRAICVVSPQENLSVGVDIESYLAPEKCAKLTSLIVHNSELNRLPTSITFQQAITLCFSAKESLYKALYPLLGISMDFSEAEVLDIDILQKTFSMAVLNEAYSHFFSGNVFSGNFILFSDYVFTYINIDVPEQLLKRVNYEYC